MPIPLDCDCGRSFRIKEQLAGKKVRCPDCSTVLAVPAPDADDEVATALLADDPSDEHAPARRSWQSPVESYTVAPAAARPAPAKPNPRPVVRRKRRESSGPRVAFEQGWFGSVNSGVVGGLLMMGIAVVWFVVGLAAGWLFYYPPVLLVIGFIAMVKGMTGGR